MAKAFSVASWNVRHFGESEHNEERVAFLAEQEPDVVGIYEVQGKEVWRELMAGMPGYSFFITEGRNAQEILLGIGPGVTAFLTQKIEFQAENAFMRPGALLTVRVEDEYYALLFLHVASMTGARGFGLRADMTLRAFEFKDDLAGAAGGEPNYIFLGDLNTMGMDYQYGSEGPGHPLKVQVDEDHEVAGLSYQASKYGMRVLTKTAALTYGSPGGLRSNLDHVVVADHLEFKSFDGSEVDVRGWPELPDPDDQRAWIEKFSDHALLYFEVQRV
jgi:hypothetical protein